MNIVVESITPENKGSLRATAIVNVNGKLRIRGARVAGSEGGRLWVNMPARPDDSSGERKWNDVVELLDPELRKAVENAVLDAYKRMQQTKEDDPPEFWK